MGTHLGSVIVSGCFRQENAIGILLRKRHDSAADRFDVDLFRLDSELDFISELELESRFRIRFQIRIRIRLDSKLDFGLELELD